MHMFVSLSLPILLGVAVHTIASSEGGVGHVRRGDRAFAVATWNVLCIEDEYDPSYGCPLQIALCGGNATREQECTAARRARVWAALEQRSEELDVVCLQEAEPDFFSLQPAKSTWTVVARVGQLAILHSKHSSFAVEGRVRQVPVQGMCDGSVAPVAAFSRNTRGRREGGTRSVVAVASVHTAASIADFDGWLRAATAVLEAAMLSDSQQHPDDSSASRFIVGGDFNHNLSSASIAAPWHVHSTRDNKRRPLAGGTSQKEDNWMGDFDGFLSKGFLGDNLMQKFEGLETHNVGFIPKVVVGLPQKGVRQETAQFARSPAWSSGGSQMQWPMELWFSASSSFDGDREIVPHADPQNETLSDHLLVTGAFWVGDEADTVGAAADVPDTGVGVATGSSVATWI